MKIYTDGSYDGKSDTGSWAYIAFDSNMGVVARRSDWIIGTTINRMEYISFMEAVGWLEAGKIDPNSVEVITDSQLLTNSYNQWIPGWKARGWKKGDGKEPENMDLVAQLDSIRTKYPGLKLKWVRGHNGDAGNEMVDKLAVETRTKRKSVVDSMGISTTITRPVTAGTLVRVVTATDYIIPNDGRNIEVVCQEWFSNDNLRKTHAARESRKVGLSETFLYKEIVEDL